MDRRVTLTYLMTFIVCARALQLVLQHLPAAPTRLCHLLALQSFDFETSYREAFQGAASQSILYLCALFDEKQEAGKELREKFSV